MTEPGHAGEDFVGGLGPRERLRSRIGEREVSLDRRDEFPRAPVRAAADLLLREGGEPALDEIEPGRTGGSEVQMIPGTLGQPSPAPEFVWTPCWRR